MTIKKKKQMICENAENCSIQDCDHKEKHDEMSFCNRGCCYYNGVRDSKCIEYKEKEKEMRYICDHVSKCNHYSCSHKKPHNSKIDQDNPRENFHNCDYRESKCIPYIESKFLINPFTLKDLLDKESCRDSYFMSDFAELSIRFFELNLKEFTDYEQFQDICEKSKYMQKKFLEFGFIEEDKPKTYKFRDQFLIGGNKWTLVLARSKEAMLMSGRYVRLTDPFKIENCNKITAADITLMAAGKDWEKI